MKGRIHSFQSFGTVDGPGVRFVVFMQGCAWRCQFCHNPDTWDMDGGEEYTPQEVLGRILRVRPYLSGGVTVSGGEPLLQAEFVAELFGRLKAQGLHTALDTSGMQAQRGVDALLDVCDLVLLDVKPGMPAPLAFLQKLQARNMPTWVRHVVVPTINDAPADMDGLLALLAPYASCIQRVQLLGFSKLCLEKYQQMGIPFPYGHLPQMPKDKLTILQSHIDDKRNNTP